MKRIVSILMILTILYSNSIAQKKLAIINDQDGFTNIRTGMGSQFDIIGQIKTDEFFYCEKTNNDWYPVDALNWVEKGVLSGEPLKGFFHKSLISILEELPMTEQKSIISKVFMDFKKLNDKRNRFQKTQGEIYILKTK